MPPRSVLSLLLFIILLSTIPSVLSVLYKILADDVCTFSVTTNTLDEAEKFIYGAMERFAEWTNKMKLKINN